MAGGSSEDDCDEEGEEERFGSYSLSADVSESESCSSFSCAGNNGNGGCFEGEGCSSSVASTPRPAAAAGRSFSFPATVMAPVIGGRDVVLWEGKRDKEKKEGDLSEVEMMKERFAKLLLGEDMSGGGKGVCSALAISNAITNLSATVFGELWRLEPLAPQKKAMWCREMDWLLSVSDSIVELVPSIQQFPGGGAYEVMATRPRSDLYVNLPALKKLDAMLVGILEGFSETEFWYVDRGILMEDGNVCTKDIPQGRPSLREEEKWWLPCPKVPSNGLSEEARKRLHQCKDCANQILKATMAINSSVIDEMEIPSAYMEALPKSGRDCLGSIIYRYITAEQFSPECLIDCLDLSSEHQTVEIVNRIEAAVCIWKQKDQKKSVNQGKGWQTSWGGKVKGLVADADKNYSLAERAEILLQSLRLRYPGLPQTALDMNKIQYNKDVGQSILESYSRVMESLAFNIIARIDDVIYVDDAVKRFSSVDSMTLFGRGGLGCLPIQRRMSPSPFSIKQSPNPTAFTTPAFFSSTPSSGSPRGTSSANDKKTAGIQEKKPAAADLEKSRSYAETLSSRRSSGDAFEQD
ncbi:hypothetical protein MLD38_032255 [Melastoma candidum]|uniref:Uncharacterized protein n=1 Tax=Melastoma candidum TaxID=119954 RepID=A0ACB9M4C8_9MYRT|nr:hypothetical protein MLD38_032255 [Melastoma candidum]